VIYATCSPEYFAAHGAAFRKSAERHGNQCRIDVIEDGSYPEISKRYVQRHTFYASMRWFLLSELLDQQPWVLVCDIDSIFNGKIEVPEEFDIGLFFRPHLPAERKVMCSASYWTTAAKPFVKRLCERLETNLEWGCDQEEIWKQTLEDAGKYRVLGLGRDFVSYHFDPDALIWTSKGPVRKSDPVYLERKALYA
jgi:hypothetical protein